MAINAFQQGQAFQQTTEARQLNLDAKRREERGINALGAKFGETALAPSSFATVTNAVGNEDTRQRNIKNNEANREILLADREAALKLGATEKLVGFFEAGIKNGQTPEDIVTRAGPALLALGVSEEEIGSLPQDLADNPGLIAEFRGALNSQKAASTPRRVVGQPIPIKMPNGSTGLLQTFTDGTTQVIDDVTPLASENATRRADISERRLDVSEGALDIRLSELDRKNLTSIRAELKETNQRRTFSETTVAAAGTVTRDINAILELAETATGFGGNTMVEALTRAGAAGIPGTDPFEVQKLIDSVKSNVGIDSLLRIKASGAGLGQVPQSQLEVLQSLLGNLSITRDPVRLLSDLKDINTRYTSIIADSQKDIDRLDKRELELFKRRQTIEERAFPQGSIENATSIDDLLELYSPEGN